MLKKSSITNENATWFLPSFLPSSTLRIFCKWLTFPVESYNNSRNYKIGDVYSNGFCTSSSISSWQAAVWDLFISKTIESKCNSVPYNWIKMQLLSFTIESKCNSVPFFNSQLFFTHPFTNVAWEIWMNCFWFSWWVGGIVFVGHFDVWGFRVGISRAQNLTLVSNYAFLTYVRCHHHFYVQQCGSEFSVVLDGQVVVDWCICWKNYLHTWMLCFGGVGHIYNKGCVTLWPCHLH